MFSTPYRSLWFISLLLTFSLRLSAQPMLPDIVGVSDKGINVLSWTCQYDGLKSIAVQRSQDSVFNFTTIGYIKDLKKGPQAFIDGHPLPGDNWYRLYIIFNSDLTWYSNRFNLVVDSLDIALKGVIPPNDSLQKLASSVRVETGEDALSATEPKTRADTLKHLVNRLKISIPSAEEFSAYTYIRSKYVYTNPFTGHVNMELPEEKPGPYVLQFFDNQKKKVLEMKGIRRSPLVIDKRNFQKKGVYKFELSRDSTLVEKGMITIY